MDMGAMGAAIVAAIVLMRVVEQVVKPFFERYELDKFWLPYIALVVGGVLAWFTGLNALPVFAVSPVVGRVLTCLIIGLGPSFIYDLLDEIPQDSA